MLRMLEQEKSILFLMNASLGRKLCWILGMENPDLELFGYYLYLTPNVTLIPWQGPALYVSNDAEFSKDDWKGIISPTVGSLKRDNPEKVGKFGIGFSSVYHITGSYRS